MSVIMILIILFTHWFADFVLQTNKQALNKWHSFRALVSHTGTYMLPWAVVGLGYVITNLDTYARWSFTWFMIITFVCHTITDYFTSKLNHRLAEKAGKTGDWTIFFKSVGFDQFLHYAQLFITIKYLI